MQTVDLRWRDWLICIGEIGSFYISANKGFGRGRSRAAAYTGGRGPGSLLSSLDRLSPKSPVALPGGPDL